MVAKLLTRSEVAEILRCSTRRIPRTIPRVKYGRSVLFEPSDLREWIERHRVDESEPRTITTKGYVDNYFSNC